MEHIAPISALHGFLNFIIMLSVTCYGEYEGTDQKRNVWTESLTILYFDDWNELPMRKCKKEFPTCLECLLKLGWSHMQTYTVEKDSNLGVVSESFVQN